MRYLILFLFSFSSFAQKLPDTVKFIRDSAGVDTTESVTVEVEVRANRGGTPNDILPAFTVPILNSGGDDTGDTLSVMPRVVGDLAGLIGELPDVAINEEESSTITIPAQPGVRVFVEGLPRGSIFKENTRQVNLRPNFVQSGEYTVNVTAINTQTGGEQTKAFNLTVNDSINLAAPTIIGQNETSSSDIYTIEFDNRGGWIGDPFRIYEVQVTIPKAASETDKRGARIVLHGSGSRGTLTPEPDGVTMRLSKNNAGWGIGGVFTWSAPEEINISHTGTQSDWPDPIVATSTFRSSSQNRNIYILDWIRRNFEGLDMNKIFVEGTSMGGNGSANMLSRYGYLITLADSRLGDTAAKYHASSGKQNSLLGHWGNMDGSTKHWAFDMSAWEIYDTAASVTNAYSEIFDRPWAKEVFFYGDNGVNDSLTSFKNWTATQPNIGMSFVEALEDAGVPHQLCWDQGGHGTHDQVLLNRGYSLFWCGKKSSASYLDLRLDKAYVAFTNSSIDEIPPKYNPNTDAFDADPNAHLRGTIGRHVSWDNDSVVDTHRTFEIDLYVLTAPQSDDYDPNIPSEGEGWQGALPVTTDVTIRREQKFIGLPGETIAWQFGTQQGTITVASDRDIKVTGLILTDQPKKLILNRVGWN